MRFGDVRRKDLELIRIWRNEDLRGHRTPYYLTSDDQDRFWGSRILDRNNHRYWAIYESDEFVGIANIQDISWINRRGEIGIIIKPNRRRTGLGTKAVKELLRQGFEELNLHSLVAEVFDSNPVKDFWEHIESLFTPDDSILKNYTVWSIMMPDTKWVDGRYWNSQIYVYRNEK